MPRHRGQGADLVWLDDGQWYEAQGFSEELLVQLVEARLGLLQLVLDAELGSLILLEEAPVDLEAQLAERAVHGGVEGVLI